MTPYVDPVVLAVLTLGLVFVPIRTVRKALQEILLITPPELDRQVREVMEKVVAKYDFRSFTSYVAKVGRAQFIEIHIAVTPDWPLTSIAAADFDPPRDRRRDRRRGPAALDHHRLHRRSALAVASRRPWQW